MKNLSSFNHLNLCDTKEDILKNVANQATLEPINFHCMDKKDISQNIFVCFTYGRKSCSVNDDRIKKF